MSLPGLFACKNVHFQTHLYAKTSSLSLRPCQRGDLQLFREVIEDRNQRRTCKTLLFFGDRKCSEYLKAYFSAFDSDCVEQFVFDAFFILIRKNLNMPEFGISASFAVELLDTGSNGVESRLKGP